MRTLRRSAGAFTTYSSPQSRPWTVSTPGSARRASRSLIRNPLWRNAAAPRASDRGPWSRAMKLRDWPIEMRSSYTSVFIADASEVIDTTEAAPNTIPESVSTERSLCPRISRSASPISSSHSRIAQRLHRRQAGGAQRREEPREQPNRQRRHRRHGRDERAHHGGHLHEMRDHAREGGAEA